MRTLIAKEYWGSEHKLFLYLANAIPEPTTIDFRDVNELMSKNIAGAIYPLYTYLEPSVVSKCVISKNVHTDIRETLGKTMRIAKETAELAVSVGAKPEGLLFVVLKACNQAADMSAAYTISRITSIPIAVTRLNFDIEDGKTTRPVHTANQSVSSSSSSSSTTVNSPSTSAGGTSLDKMSMPAINPVMVPTTSLPV